MRELHRIIAVCALILCGPSSPSAEPFVVVELFTSEGCSSCPSADRLLEVIGKGEDSPSSEEEGHRAFEMILGIYHSYRAGGRRVSMPLDERRHPLEV